MPSSHAADGSDLNFNFNLKMEDKIENCTFDRRDENPTFPLSSPNSQTTTLLVKNPTAAAASSRTAPLVGRSAPGCCPILEGEGKEGNQRDAHSAPRAGKSWIPSPA